MYISLQLEANICRPRIWENGLTRMLLAPFPSISARKGCRARSQFLAAITDHIDCKGYEHVSALTKARYNTGVTWGLSNDEIARFEIGSIMGVLINSTPTLFWLLVHIYSDPALLKNLRDEAENGVTISNSHCLRETAINVPTLKQKFPLLLSAYQETLRFRTHNASSRLVTQDTLLASTFFLRAGSIVQIPGACIHSLPGIWGTDHATYRADRFLKPSITSDKKERKEEREQHPGAFRSFGGGTFLCPRRHFATTEICAVAAMFVFRFDMSEGRLPDRAENRTTIA